MNNLNSSSAVIFETLNKMRNDINSLQQHLLCRVNSDDPSSHLLTAHLRKTKRGSVIKCSSLFHHHGNAKFKGNKSDRCF